MTNAQIRIAAAVIHSRRRRSIAACAQARHHSHYAAGGKVDANEHALTALAREVRENLAAASTRQSAIPWAVHGSGRQCDRQMRGLPTFTLLRPMLR
jgi:ADP-ribose pyrophosphatase YjhB (NUDIX family)